MAWWTACRQVLIPNPSAPSSKNGSSSCFSLLVAVLDIFAVSIRAFGKQETMVPAKSILAAALSVLALSARQAAGFLSTGTRLIQRNHDVGTTSSNPAFTTTRTVEAAPQQLFLSSNDDSGELEKTFGGYTVKQRLREEIESPFRTVRLFLFGFSTFSALVALYFSFLNTIKAAAGTFPDAPPLNDAITSDVINVIALLVCGGITYRDWQLGEANLARIKQGGALAKLVVRQGKSLNTLADFRRSSRVLIAAGGPEYIRELCRSINADQLKDENTIPAAMEMADMVLVPVLLQSATDVESVRVGDTAECWSKTEPDEEKDRNFDLSRSDDVVAFPAQPGAWADVLKLEVSTALGQGFDVSEKGITLLLKKNGRILRRATGQPQWNAMLGTMEVLDGSKFGMPGDDEKYGS